MTAAIWILQFPRVLPQSTVHRKTSVTFSLVSELILLHLYYFVHQKNTSEILHFYTCTLILYIHFYTYINGMPYTYLDYWLSRRPQKFLHTCCTCPRGIEGSDLTNEGKSNVEHPRDFEQTLKARNCLGSEESSRLFRSVQPSNAAMTKNLYCFISQSPKEFTISSSSNNHQTKFRLLNFKLWLFTFLKSWAWM